MEPLGEEATLGMSLVRSTLGMDAFPAKSKVPEQKQQRKAWEGNG